MPKTSDMTHGPILKAVVFFAIPICIGNILQQLYNTVDTLIIGNFCSSASLAAVGTSAQPIEIVLCLFMGLGSAVTILVSQCIGSDEKEKLNNIISSTVSFLYICTFFLTVFGILFTPTILKFMRVPEDAFHYSVIYVSIVFLGTLGNMGYNMNAGILRGMGDSRSSLFFLVISCITNIVLDLLFIAVFHMDVAGAALATMLAMYVSWICSIIYIKRKYPELNLPIFPKTINKSIIKEVITLGLPLGLNNSIYSVGHLLIQSLVNAQGTSFMAAFAIATKITGITKVAISSFASAAMTFAGQNKGAQNYIRLKKGAFIIPFISGLVMFVTGMIGTIFCRQLFAFFTDDIAVLDYAVRYTWVVLPTFWTYASFDAIIHYINGMGKVKYTTIINLLMLWAVRIPVSYAIDYFYDGTYFMYSMPINYIFGLVCMIAYFIFSKQWKEVCKQAKSQKNCTNTVL